MCQVEFDSVELSSKGPFAVSCACSHHLSPGGCGPAEKMANDIRAYAGKVASDAFWLDWVDGVLFAENCDKTLGFITHCRAKGAPLTISHANDSLRQIPGLEAEGGNHAVERTSDTWLVMACNVGYDPRGPCNHWIPCVFKEVVQKSTYDELVHQQVASLKVQIASLQSDLLDIELEEDAEVAAVLHETINDQIASYLTLKRNNLWALVKVRIFEFVSCVSIAK